MLLRVLVILLLGLLPSSTQQSYTCSTSQVGQVRLAGGNSYGGIVEICHQINIANLATLNYWLPVCNIFNSWDSTTAAFICQTLNFSTAQPHEFQAFTITNQFAKVSPYHIVPGVTITCDSHSDHLTCSYKFLHNCITNGVFQFGAVMCKIPYPKIDNIETTAVPTNKFITTTEIPQETKENSSNLTDVHITSGNLTRTDFQNSSTYEELESESCTVITGVLGGVLFISITFATLLALLSALLYYRKVAMATKPKEAHKVSMARKESTSQQKAATFKHSVQAAEIKASNGTEGTHESEVECYYDDAKTPSRLYSDLESFQDYGVLEKYGNNEEALYNSLSQSGQYSLLSCEGVLPKPAKDSDYCKLNYH